MTEVNNQQGHEDTILSLDRCLYQEEIEPPTIRFRYLDSFSIMATQLFLGVAAGYLGYMRGIQTCDWILIGNFFVLQPAMWFLIFLFKKNSETKNYLWLPILLNPFIFLLGFYLSYRYPHSLRGAWLFSGIFVIVSSIAAILGQIGNRWIRSYSITLPIWSLWLYLLLYLVSSIGILARPYEFKEVNALSHFGQGILNTRSDDNMSIGSGMRGFVWDGSEGSRSLQAYPIPIILPSRDRKLAGPILKLLGLTRGEQKQYRTKVRSEKDLNTIGVELQQKGLPVLINLGDGTSVPCKLMAPILEELKKELAGKIIVQLLDLNTNPKLAQQYRISVIPTQIFIDASGKEVFRHEGFYSKEAILAEWKELGIEITRSR